MHTLGISHGKKGKQRQRHKFCRVFSLWICHCRGEADMEIKMFTIFQFYFLGKDGISKSDEFLEKFQKGGGHFQSKNLCGRFLPL